MRVACHPAARRLETRAPQAPLLPLMANVTAAPVSEPDAIRALLVEQVTGRVRWRESMAALWELGVTDFVELGGKVVAPMVKRTVADATITSVMSMDDIEALLKTM